MLDIMPIPNLFKDMLSSNTKALAEAKQIYMLSNNIFGLGKRERGLNREKNFLKNQLQAHQQCHDTSPLFFDTQHRNRKKVLRKKDNKDKKSHYKVRREAVVQEKRISEVNVNYYMIQK